MRRQADDALFAGGGGYKSDGTNEVSAGRFIAPATGKNRIVCLPYGLYMAMNRENIIALWEMHLG